MVSGASTTEAAGLCSTLFVELFDGDVGEETNKGMHSPHRSSEAV